MSEGREPYAPAAEGAEARMTAEEFVTRWRELIAAGYAVDMVTVCSPTIVHAVIYHRPFGRDFAGADAAPVEAFALAFAQYRAATETGQEGTK